MSGEKELIINWTQRLEPPLKAVYTNHNGSYVLARGSWILWDWSGQEIWADHAARRPGPMLDLVSVSPTGEQGMGCKHRTFGKAAETVFGFDASGKVLWGLETPWVIKALHLNGGPPLISAVREHSLAALNHTNGQPRWQFDFGKTTLNAVMVSGDGERVILASKDKKLTCLIAANGRQAWQLTLPAEGVAGAATDEIVLVGDAEGTLHCLGINGSEICQQKFPQEKINSVAISTSSRYVTVSTDQSIRQLFLRAVPKGGLVIDPKRPLPPGAEALANQLDHLQPLSLHLLAHDLFLETAQAYILLDEQGAIRWQLGKTQVEAALKSAIQPSAPPPTSPFRPGPGVRPPLPPQPPIDPRIAKMATFRRDFFEFVTQLGQSKSPEYRAKENIRFENEILDLYYDARGYLFVPEASADTVRRAAKLTKHLTSVYIVAWDVPSDIVQMVKQTRKVDLYELHHMKKAVGWLSGFFGMTSLDLFAARNDGQTFENF